mmetsp:Transcript_14761/g.40562  ORF Transcript_14761/g.40562 Transcript_14761/m.40562 type:complete len:460 (-) Transcript_14761:558-1937(-)
MACGMAGPSHGGAPQKIDLEGLESYPRFRFNPAAQEFSPEGQGSGQRNSRGRRCPKQHAAQQERPIQFQPNPYLQYGHGQMQFGGFGMGINSMYQMSGGTAPGKGWSKQGKQSSRRKVKATAPPPDDIPEVSEALTEVKSHGNRCKLSLEQVQDHLIEFALDEAGSQFLIAKFEASWRDGGVHAHTFEGLRGATVKLAGDTYGRHVVQKLLDRGSREQREALVRELQADVATLACDYNGCHVIQKALQCGTPEMQMWLAEELKAPDRVSRCIESPHGNHVIQKCIEHMPPKNVSFVIDAIQDRAQDVAGHRFGCRVILRLFEYCNPDQLKALRARILECVADLARSPYGNYVVQEMLGSGELEETQQIIGVIRDDIVDFAKVKWSSNVVEKCFQVASGIDEERRRLMLAVLGVPGETSPLRKMVHDRYGAYVVQRILEYSKDGDRKRVQEEIDLAGRSG